MKKEILQKDSFTYSTSKLPKNWGEKDLVTEDNQKIECLGDNVPAVFISLFDKLDETDEDFKVKDTFISYLATDKDSIKLLTVQNGTLYTINVRETPKTGEVMN